MGPKSNDKYPYKKKGREIRDALTHREAIWRRGRDWRCALTTKAVPGATRSWKRRGLQDCEISIFLLS